MPGYHLDLQKLPLFRGLSSEETETFIVGTEASVRRYEKGRHILRADEKNESIGVLIEGEAQVLTEDPFGNEAVSHVLERGAVIGSTSAILPQRMMNTSVMATQNTIVLWIPYRMLLLAGSRMGKIHGIVMKNLLETFARKNILMAEKIELLARKTLRERLVLYLQQRARRQGSEKVQVPGRVQMAKELECNRSALTREIAAMKTEGIITCGEEWMLLTTEKLS